MGHSDQCRQQREDGGGGGLDAGSGWEYSLNIYHHGDGHREVLKTICDSDFGAGRWRLDRQSCLWPDGASFTVDVEENKIWIEGYLPRISPESKYLVLSYDINLAGGSLSDYLEPVVTPISL
jgi:hypothetical protein